MPALEVSCICLCYTRRDWTTFRLETYDYSQVHQLLYLAYPSLSNSSSPKALVSRFYREIAPYRKEYVEYVVY